MKNNSTIETLVGGILALTWMTMVASALQERAFVSPLNSTNHLVGGLIFLGFAYAAGVVLAPLWERLTSGVDYDARTELGVTDEEHGARLRQVFDSKDAASQHVSQAFSRMGVARAVTCNSFLLLAAALFYRGKVYNDSFEPRTMFLSLCALGLCFLSYSAFARLAKSYYQQLRLVTTYETASAEKPQ